VKLDYTGHEDEIIQKLEAGNVSLPLQGQLIQGSQSLFGLKTELRFGRLTATAIFSQEKGNARTWRSAVVHRPPTSRSSPTSTRPTSTTSSATTSGTTTRSRFAHLAHGEQRHADHPVEVWVTNTRFDYEHNRNIVAFTDLGEDASAAAWPPTG
jgi:hypothetical protein